MAGPDLGVRGVAGFEDNLLPGIDLDDGRYVGMPAVVAELWLLLEAFGAIDGDGLHGFPPMCTQIVEVMGHYMVETIRKCGP